MRRRVTVALVVGLLGLGFSTTVRAASQVPIPVHNTDGSFNDWTGVTPTNFALNPDGSGGAALYLAQGVEGGPNTAIVVRPSPSAPTLFLGYDIHTNPAGVPPLTTQSFFDVFFEVRSDGNAYVAHITPNTVTDALGTRAVTGAAIVDLYERPVSSPAHFIPNTTTIDLSDWEHLPTSDPDFISGRPRAAIGITGTPDNPVPHIFVEFQLDINNNLTGPDGQSRDGGQPSQNPGLYDPAPAFWSSSGKPNSLDPPFTSGIFSLNADGTSNVSGGTNPDGSPMVLPADTPEPSTLVLAGFAGVFAAGYGLRRRKSAVVA